MLHLSLMAHREKKLLHLSSGLKSGAIHEITTLTIPNHVNFLQSLLEILLLDNVELVLLGQVKLAAGLSVNFFCWSMVDCSFWYMLDYTEYVCSMVLNSTQYFQQIISGKLEEALFI